MRRELNIKRWKDLMKWGEKSVQTFVCGFVWNGDVWMLSYQCRRC